MRKDRVKQKKKKVVQLNLFKDLTKPENYHEGRTCNDGKTGVELLSQLEKRPTLTVNLMEEVVDYGNLLTAYYRMRQN